MNLTARHDFPIAEIERLEVCLYGHNREATGHRDGRGLAFEILDEQDVQVGAIAGYSWAGMAEIRQLWVDEIHRGNGWGRALIMAVIAEATSRGCRLVWVTTHNFQAPRLYEKCGFRRAAELADWPPGHSKIILRRGLDIGS